MKNEIIPVDTVRAGTQTVLSSEILSAFKKNTDNKNNIYYYKSIKLENKSKIIFYYYENFNYFSVQCSLPKIVYGTNSKTLLRKDLAKAVSIINKVISDAKINLNFEDFKISKIEISYNYFCSDVKGKQKYIELFSKNKISRRKCVKYKTSVVFKNKQLRTTIYDKSDEMAFRDKKCNLTPKENRILRVEHKLNKKSLKKYIKDLTVFNVLENVDLIEVLKEENKKVDLNMMFLSKNDFYKKLNELISNKRFDTQIKIIKFYKDLNRYGFTYIKQNYSPYLVRTYINIMKSKGYSYFYYSCKNKIIDFENFKNAAICYTKNEIKIIIKKYQKPNKENLKNENFIFQKTNAVFVLLLGFINLIHWFDTS